MPIPSGSWLHGPSGSTVLPTVGGPTIGGELVLVRVLKSEMLTSTPPPEYTFEGLTLRVRRRPFTVSVASEVVVNPVSVEVPVVLEAGLG